MSEDYIPRLLETIEHWEIRQWQYDGARPEALGEGVSVEYSCDGERIYVEWDEKCDDFYGTTTRRTSIPVAVLKRLLAEV